MKIVFSEFETNIIAGDVYSVKNVPINTLQVAIID